jgi:hypothetical protein
LVSRSKSVRNGKKLTLTSYKDRRNNMKISKIAIAVLLAAGFLTASASSSMATSCAEGFVAVEGTFPEPMYTCEAVDSADVAVDGPIDVKPIDSCWTTEDGTDVCSRSAVPMPANGEEPPVDGGVCDPEASGLVDSEGKTPEACYYDAVPYEVTGEEGEPEPVSAETVDESLMFQSGVTKSGATPNDQTASSALAAFGVLVGALGALGIALSREKVAK